jgi:hypothetical protein
MAAANESQGLKIAVAAFIALTVILLVTSYFLYTAYASADAKMLSALEAEGKAKAGQSAALKQYDEMRVKIGTRAEEFDQAKEEIGAHTKKVDEKLNTITTEVNNAVAKAVQAGASGPELDDAKLKIQTAIQSYRSEPNKNYISSLDRVTDLMENLAILTTELSVDYSNIRKNLEAATSVSKVQNDVQAKAATDSRADLEAEHKKHDEERGSLLTKVDQLQTDSDKKATEIASLTTKIKQLEEDFTRKQELQTSIIRELRDRLEQNENILDRPDGTITYVDYEQRQVLVDVTRRMGATPQQKFTIFDAASPGIPTEKPKGTIMLTKIGDTSSVGTILKTNNPIDPIRIGDIVYSPAWSPNVPMRFALVGKMDVNRDDRDDREELKRMIQEAGGVVEFDLPPPEVGKKNGTLSPRIDWYVIDKRMPLRQVFSEKSSEGDARRAQHEKEVGEVIKEARLNGIRPMLIERLLAYLGYDMNAAVVGRAQGVNNSAMRRLTGKRQQTTAPAAKPATSTKADDADEMKDDQPKAVTPKGAAPKGAAAKAAAAKKADDDAGTDKEEPK